VTLAGFDYTVAPTYLRELGRRIGCDRAADLAAHPAKGQLPETIAALFSPANAAKPLYRRIGAALWNRDSNGAACAVGAPAAVNDPVAGLKALVEAVKAPHAKRGVDVGVTLVVVGGLGSYMNPGSILTSSVAAWKAEAAARPEELRVFTVNCPVYDTDDVCAPKVLEATLELDRANPRAKPQRFVLWGYSQGGLTALHALAASAWLRERTDVVVTVAAPMAGAAVARFLVPFLDELMALRERDEAAFQAGLKALQTMLSVVPGVGGFAPLADDLPAMRRVYASILPEVVQTHLERDLKPLDFRHANGQAIKFLHVAGVHDLADIPGLPLLTVTDGALGVKVGGLRVHQTVELLGMPIVREHPLADPLIALEHAVLPRALAPRGVDPRLIALVNLDHSGLGHGGNDDGRPFGLAFAPMVDALMATAAKEAAQ
jgi:hypothetical protein